MKTFQKWFGGDMVVVSLVDEAIKKLDTGEFKAVFLDHDLGDLKFDPYPHELTGTDVARHIASMPADKRPGLVVIHSHNPFGRNRMFQILESAGMEPVLAPFPQCGGLVVE